MTQLVFGDPASIAVQVKEILCRTAGRPVIERLLALGEQAPGEAHIARMTMAKNAGDFTPATRLWLDECHSQAPELFV